MSAEQWDTQIESNHNWCELRLNHIRHRLTLLTRQVLFGTKDTERFCHRSFCRTRIQWPLNILRRNLSPKNILCHKLWTTKGFTRMQQTDKTMFKNVCLCKSNSALHDLRVIKSYGVFDGVSFVWHAHHYTEFIITSHIGIEWIDECMGIWAPYCSIGKFSIIRNFQETKIIRLNGL